MTRLALFVATFGYLGYIPYAPGTMGSAAGLMVFWVLRASGSLALEAGTIILLLALGVWSGTLIERHFAINDPGQGVLDEVAGMLITLFLVPAGVSAAIAGFVLFRLFDVVKPFPARRLERLPGGLGMMADDAMAAVYSNLALRALMWAAPAWIQ